MNQYSITVSNSPVPTFKVLAHTVAGALAKAEAVHAKLLPGRKNVSYTATLVKRNVR